MFIAAQFTIPRNWINQPFTVLSKIWDQPKCIDKWIKKSCLSFGSLYKWNIILTHSLIWCFCWTLCSWNCSMLMDIGILYKFSLFYSKSSHDYTTMQFILSSINEHLWYFQFLQIALQKHSGMYFQVHISICGCWIYARK